MLLEIPYSRELVEAVWLAAGGSILAAQYALRDGFGANLGGRFHHAYPDHGEGFCAIHDVPWRSGVCRRDGAICKAMVVDTDVHHGNGTAAIFRNDSFGVHDIHPSREQLSRGQAAFQCGPEHGGSCG